MRHPLKEMLDRRARGDKTASVCSVCSANEYVILAAMEESIRTGRLCLIEATANQVNQFGGYTGMKPRDFMDYTLSLASKAGLPRELLCLGGDHLGPLTWQNEPEESAMAKAEVLIKDFTSAGFTKIHIDTSMRLANDDKNAPLSDEVIASRAAHLAKFVNSDSVVVIGSEVPIPGGAHGSEETVTVTKPEAMTASLEAFRDAFDRNNVSFDNVIAVVVQPGVEFGDDSVIEYDRAKAASLIKALPEGLCFEGHSTDYQTKALLREMAEDGICILKVGPALTFALREALFSLEGIEREICCGELSNFRKVLEKAMTDRPEDWKKHYHGDEAELAFKRGFSYSDRCRYYLPEPSVSASVKRLIENINAKKPPLSLVSQYMPTVYTRIRENSCVADAESMIKARVKDYLNDYQF